MATLARKLRLIDYFALGFGVTVGTAWLVTMDDLLARGGSVGAILGFAAGGLMLLPIGYVYGQLVREIPDAAAEVAYTARFFSPGVSFATGWMMFLSYFLTCPFEALAAGRIAGYLFPSLNAFELYRLGGRPVYLPQMVLGLTITVLLTWLNWRGIEASARFLKGTTFLFLGFVLVFALAGAKHGALSNLSPLFSRAPLVSIFLVWQVVPWIMAGFESVVKCVEEATPDFRERDYSVAITLTIVVSAAFYCFVIAAVAYVAPWQTLNHNDPFPTALAFERAVHARWIVDLIMASALVAVLKTFNGNMVASSRLLFAMGRRNLLERRMAYIHPVNQTPSTAVIAVGVATIVAIFLGEALLIPILEVGAIAAAVAWMSACASYYRMKPAWGGRAAALMGLLVTSLMVLAKLVPFVPGHFTVYEWIALGVWASLGGLISRSRSQTKIVTRAVEVADA
ncbi:MAG: APC family permease [Acidobacteriia bacterium]|nr:APC family permease [Terriglobia bacterium]